MGPVFQELHPAARSALPDWRGPIAPRACGGDFQPFRKRHPNATGEGPAPSGPPGWWEAMLRRPRVFEVTVGKACGTGARYWAASGWRIPPPDDPEGVLDPQRGGERAAS